MTPTPHSDDESVVPEPRTARSTTPVTSRRVVTAPDEPDDASHGRPRRKDNAAATMRHMTSPQPRTRPVAPAAGSPAHPSPTPVQAVILVSALVVIATIVVALVGPVAAGIVGFLVAVLVLGTACLMRPPKDAGRHLVGLFRRSD